MKVLFISLGELNDLKDGSVHIDLMKAFAKEHDVYVICKREKRQHKETELAEECGIHVLRVKTGNIKNVPLIEKGISTVLLETQFKNAYKKYLDNIVFDLVIYTTPPITIANTVAYIKKKTKAFTYLCLKDIFPQNAVDLEMMQTTGPKGLLYKYFRNKEKKLYAISNKIGCMSPANVEYVLNHNPEIDSSKVEVCPNAIEVQDLRLTEAEKLAMRKKYDIPMDKKVFVYGGNLGKPQGVDFMIDCLKRQEQNQNAFFLIVGKGTEYGLLQDFVNQFQPTNVKLMEQLPKEDYDKLVGACDVGMIFLDHRFTIPNFPSRLLSYMQAGLPVLACTDPNTDIGKVITEGGFGWWCESDDIGAFVNIVDNVVHSNIAKMGTIGTEYLEEHYSIEKAYQTIMKNI